jgi:hypothetical protein
MWYRGPDGQCLGNYRVLMYLFSEKIFWVADAHEHVQRLDGRSGRDVGGNRNATTS